MSPFDPAGLKEKLTSIEEEMNKPDFWDDPESAQKYMKEKKSIEGKLGELDHLGSQLEDLEVLVEMAEEEPDESLTEEAAGSCKEISDALEALKLRTLLDGKYDQNNAIVSVHAGAGGTDAQDWAEMLFRMYTRWCEKKGYKSKLIDMQEDTEGGIKSATLLVEGENAYGYLKNEKGVHRLVRISPFDSSGRRHTSFASLDVIPEIDEDLDVEIDLPGRFSVYNSLMAIAVCRHFGVADQDILYALKQAKVKGRIELIKVSDDFTLMIDYAHNAMSLESLLTTLKEYNPKRLVCLFGCGGNRSKLRRYEMGEVSGRLADLTIITSDNPRDEEPQAIIDDIKVGIAKTDGKYVEIPDRKEAIAYAIHHGQPGDVIVLAGKGHEDYQEIRGVKHPMDERDLIADILAGR